MIINDNAIVLEKIVLFNGLKFEHSDSAMDANSVVETYAVLAAIEVISNVIIGGSDVFERPI